MHDTRAWDIYKLLQGGHPQSHKAAGVHQGEQSEPPPDNQQGHMVNVWRPDLEGPDEQAIGMFFQAVSMNVWIWIGV